MSRAPVCCPPPGDGGAPLAASPEHVAAFKALAHLDRLRVFFFLVQAGEAVAVASIQAAVDLPPATLSHHLASLERAGLIVRTRQARQIRSAVRRDQVSDLVRLLTACC